MNNENFDGKLNRGVEQIKNINMTAEEKARMLENILNSSASPYQSKPSPFGFSSFLSIIQKRTMVHYIVIPCLIIVLAGGGVSFASARSLPGGTLYPIKVNLVEPVSSFLKFSPESKAKYEISLFTKRLAEAEVLAESGQLDDSREEQLSNLLEYHTDALNDYHGKFNKKDKSEKEYDGIVNDFETKVNERVEKLDRIRNKESKEDKVETRISKTAKASLERVKEARDKKEQDDDDKEDTRDDREQGDEDREDREDRQED